MPKIVFLDEDQEYRNLFQDFIREKGYVAYFALTYAELLALTEHKKPLAVIIPEQKYVEETVSMFMDIRKKFPNIFIIIRLQIETQLRRIAYFYVGADDVIGKSLSFYELFYRIRRFNSSRYNQKRSVHSLVKSKNSFMTNSYLIEDNAIIDKKTGRTITHIGATSKKVLHTFSDRVNTIVPIESVEGNSGSVKVVLHRLNKLFEQSGINLRFKSIYGKGYIMKEI